MVLTLAACATQTQRRTTELGRGDRPPRIVVVPLDVGLGQVTAWGLREPHPEWTEAARRHMMAALRQEAAPCTLALAGYEAERGSLEDRETSRDLVKLDRAVGGAILLHQYVPQFHLPSSARAGRRPASTCATSSAGCWPRTARTSGPTSCALRTSTPA